MQYALSGFCRLVSFWKWAACLREMTEGQGQIVAFADVDAYEGIQWHESLLVDQMGGRYTVWGGHQEANRDANGVSDYGNLFYD